ncbi:MAG: hypothetical protein EA401_05195 [Planctomycetota bacterium]|nr:MAG: hypothetical protein EA401_05195 [Planctomycetota bacterium]
MVDDEDVLRQEFIHESAQTLIEADAVLRSITADGEEVRPHLLELFRLIHSLKGNAALFDCQAVKRLAHASEDVLGWLREQSRVPAEALELLQQTIDDLITMVDDLANGHPWPDDDTRVDARCQDLAALMADQEAQNIADVAAALQEIGAEYPDLHQRLCELAEQLQPQSVGGCRITGTPLQQLQEFLGHPSPEDGYAEEDQAWVAQCLQDLAHAAGDDATRSRILEAQSGYDVFLESVGFDSCLCEYLQEQLHALQSHGAWSWDQAQTDSEDYPQEGKGIGSSQEKTMRVAERHIETFLAYVGDLLVIGDRYHHLQRAVQADADLNQLSRDLRHANAAFQQLSEALQNSIMAVRQVAADGLLSKAARLVRSVAAQQEKKVTVSCYGHEVQLDKSLLELLDAPITHLVRNAVDHGVEPDSQRMQSGKSLPAHIRMGVCESDNQIIVEVSDDGRGLNMQAIAEAARKRGMLAGDQEVDQQTLIDCIFASGLSTSTTVSEISGRGVGLDVVRQKIREAGGDIQVETSAQGTTFRITLPRTVSTQIISGFMVRSGGEVVIVPMEQVERSLPFAAADVHALPDGRPCLEISGASVPVVCLRQILNDDQEHCGNDAPVVVYCRAGGHQVAVVVEALLGVQKVVLRPISSISQTEGLVRGGALLGDGSVALVINAEVLYHLWTRNMAGVILSSQERSKEKSQ